VLRLAACGVCGAKRGCSRGEDGLLFCRGRAGEQPGFVYLGQAEKDPQWGLYRVEGDPLLNGQDKAHRQRAHTSGSIDWHGRAASCAAGLTALLRAELAGTLGLPENVLVSLRVGFVAQGPHRQQETGKPLGVAWTFPEVDAAGRVVGLTCRYRNGEKKAWPGGQRGLFCPDGWREREGPVFLPEGPTDVLSLTAMGKAAVGRPSNTGGVDHLAELLHDLPGDRRVIVLGEYDPKPTAKWPGRDGMLHTAGRASGGTGASKGGRRWPGTLTAQTAGRSLRAARTAWGCCRRSPTLRRTAA
jgi:hypothetical protein